MLTLEEVIALASEALKSPRFEVLEDGEVRFMSGTSVDTVCRLSDLHAAAPNECSAADWKVIIDHLAAEAEYCVVLQDDPNERMLVTAIRPLQELLAFAFHPGQAPPGVEGKRRCRGHCAPQLQGSSLQWLTPAS